MRNSWDKTDTTTQPPPQPQQTHNENKKGERGERDGKMEKRSPWSLGFRFGCNQINQFFLLIYVEEKGIWRRGMVLYMWWEGEKSTAGQGHGDRREMGIGHSDRREKI